VPTLFDMVSAVPSAAGRSRCPRTVPSPAMPFTSPRATRSVRPLAVRRGRGLAIVLVLALVPLSRSGAQTHRINVLTVHVPPVAVVTERVFATAVSSADTLTRLVARYRLGTNVDNRVVVARLVEPPAGVTVRARFGAPAGAQSSGWVTLGGADAVVVEGVARVAADDLPIELEVQGTGTRRAAASLVLGLTLAGALPRILHEGVTAPQDRFSVDPALRAP
jgi:hypothetical protein